VQATDVADKMVLAQIVSMPAESDALKLPSFSIAEMMVIVAIVALDFGAIRSGTSGLATPYLVFGGAPMQGVLVIGLLLMFHRRRRVPKPVPFLLGFEVVGWIGHLVYVVLCLQAAESLDRHMVAVLTPLLNAMGASLASLDWISRYALGMAYLAAPQLAVALVGGWISQRRWKQNHPELVPTSE
jgi:hypothetical protein